METCEIQIAENKSLWRGPSKKATKNIYNAMQDKFKTLLTEENGKKNPFSTYTEVKYFEVWVFR